MADLSNHYSKDFMAPRKAEEWSKYVHGLIKQMLQDLSLLYRDVGETVDLQAVHESNDETAMLDDVPLPTLVETFLKHCDSLCLLLGTPTNWPVKLPMNSIVKVLTRCLQVTSSDLASKPSLSELADALPNLHGSAFLVLTQLIHCCGSNLLPLSKVLVDASFRCLSGAKKAKDEFKSKIRGKAFEVLGLMVERFGWGRHFQSLSSLLIQEKISDICAQEPTKANSSANTTKPKVEVESIAQRKSKKKKKGKKQKGDSYSDLPVCVADNQGSTQAKLFNVEATQAALELSYLAIQRAEFSQMKTLLQSLLQVCKNLQRESLHASSPYNSEICREKLYCAVFSSATVRLGYDCDRKDTIGHYQATNLAMSLLLCAAHSDSSPQIRDSCKKFLELLRSTGNLNRPIVRRVLPEEQMSTKDIAEVELEAERLGEENKSLWQQLVASQLEVETQRRQLEQLQASLKQAETNLRNNNDRENSRSEEDVETLEDEGDEPCLDEKESTLSSYEDETIIEVIKDISTKSVPEKETDSPFKESRKEESASSTTNMLRKDKKKRALVEEDMTSETEVKKKARTVEALPTVQSEDVEAMLLDFVDAAPDQA